MQLPARPWLGASAGCNACCHMPGVARLNAPRPQRRGSSVVVPPSRANNFEADRRETTDPAGARIQGPAAKLAAFRCRSRPPKPAKGDRSVEGQRQQRRPAYQLAVHLCVVVRAARGTSYCSSLSQALLPSLSWYQISRRCCSRLELTHPGSRIASYYRAHTQPRLRWRWATCGRRTTRWTPAIDLRLTWPSVE